MNGRTRASYVVALGLAASACAVQRPYVFAPGEVSATVRVIDGGDISVCKDGTMYSVTPPPKSQLVSIPASERIAVGRLLVYQAGNMSYSCYPMLSFTPRPSGAYALDAVVVGGRCVVELVREDPLSATGVSLELSVGPRDCFARSDAPAAPAAPSAWEQ